MDLGRQKRFDEKKGSHEKFLLWFFVDFLFVDGFLRWKKEHKGAREKSSSDKYLTTLLDSLDVAFGVATLFKGL